MKKTLILLSAILVLTYCKSKKEASAAAPAASDAVILEVANKRWAGTTQQKLNEGKSILFGQWTKCHEQKNIEKRSEKSWLHEIDEMAPKAKLSDAEKLKLTKYVLSFREANAPK